MARMHESSTYLDDRRRPVNGGAHGQPMNACSEMGVPTTRRGQTVRAGGREVYTAAPDIYVFADHKDGLVRAISRLRLTNRRSRRSGVAGIVLLVPPHDSSTVSAFGNGSWRAKRWRPPIHAHRASICTIAGA